jgi:hypothetical protein
MRGWLSASGQEHQPIIEEFAVYERVRLNRQPVDGDVHDAITKAFLEVQRPRNSIGRQHDIRGGSRYGSLQGQRALVHEAVGIDCRLVRVG